MGLRMGIVGTLIAVLVGIVVGVQVLASIFSTGGPFANIQGAVQGTCTLTQGSFSNLVFTDAAGDDVWAEVPASGLRINSGERAVTGLVSAQTGLSITTPSGVLAIAWYPVGGINYIVATDAATADFATAAPGVVTCNPATSSVTAAAAAASAGNVAVAGATTAVSTNSYAGIINAVLALIPLGIIGGVVLYFWSARGGGRSRGRRRRR